MSCSEDDVKIAAAGQMIATVENQAWSSSSAVALIYDGNITISGESADGSQTVLFVSSSAIGTFAVSGAMGSAPENIVSFTPKDADVLTNPTYSSTYSEEAAIGEIIITEIDETNKTISGTFHCKVSRFLPEEKEIEMKSGSFTKIPYTEDGGSTADNTFSVKINGSAFVPTTIGGVSGFGTITLNFATGNKAISISVPDDTNTGSFDFETFGGSYSAVYTDNTTVYESVSGSITINVHDKTNDRIEGTFSFGGELFPLGGGSLSVTEGSFGVSY